MDQVGRGRSAYVEAVYGPNNPKAPKFVEREFVAYEKYNLFPQARLHTQWPGSGTVGDPLFDQFQAEMLPDIKDRTLREELNRDAGVALLDKIGPAILMPHSQAGAYVWLMTDARPALVKGLLMVEAGSSSFYEVTYTGAPNWFKDGELGKPYGLTRTPLTYAPPVSDPKEIAIVRQDKSDAPDLVRCWLQKAPARQLINLKNIPVMLLHAEASFAMPTAHCNAGFLKQAGVDVDFVRLADLGIHGNGHFMMLEKNSLQVADVIADWLRQRVTPLETPAKKTQ
jgi:pimeloyl-ACP methyl ester carboxylesterase